MVTRLCIGSFAILAALAEQGADDSTCGIAVSRGHDKWRQVSMLQKATETNRLGMEQSRSSRQPALFEKEGPADAGQNAKDSTSEAKVVASEEAFWVPWHDARLFWKALPLLVLVLVLLLLFCVIAVSKEKKKDVESEPRWDQEAWKREIDERESRRRSSPRARKRDPRSEPGWSEPRTMPPSWGEPRAIPPPRSRDLQLPPSWQDLPRGMPATWGDPRRMPVSVGELHGMLPTRGGLQSMPLRSMPLGEGSFSSGWAASPHIAYGRGPPLPGASGQWQQPVRIPTMRATSADGRFHMNDHHMMPSMRPASSWAPSAAVAVDSTGDGHANYIYAGVDRNHDGIPDALQGPHARQATIPSGRLPHIPPTGVRSLSAGFHHIPGSSMRSQSADARYGLPNLPPLRDVRMDAPPGLYSLPFGRALQPGSTPWQTIGIGAIPAGAMVQSPAGAKVAVDANGDGRANYLFAGVDRNHDGIPDSLQLPHTRRAAIPPTALPTHLDTSGLLWPGERPRARPQPVISMLPHSFPMVQPDVATLPRSVLQPGVATSPRTLPMHLPTNGLIWPGAQSPPTATIPHGMGAPPLHSKARTASERRGDLEAAQKKALFAQLRAKAEPG